MSSFGPNVGSMPRGERQTDVVYYSLGADVRGYLCSARYWLLPAGSWEIPAGATPDLTAEGMPFPEIGSERGGWVITLSEADAMNREPGTYARQVLITPPGSIPAVSPISYLVAN